MGGDGHGALDPAQLKIAVEGILAVSSVKFITSIAGILAYIFWSVVARQQSASQVHAEERLLGEMRALSTYVAPEMLLRRQLRLLLLVVERQRRQLKHQFLKVRYIFLLNIVTAEVVIGIGTFC